MDCTICKKKNNELFICDGCSVGLCKNCGDLTSSEVKVMQLKERVMIFHCKKCKALDTLSLLQSRIKDKSDIISSKEEIISILKTQIDELKSKQNDFKLTQNLTYSQITKQVSKNPDIHVNIPSLIIKPKKQQNPAKTKADITEKINPTQLKVAIKGTRDTANGNVIVKCINNNDLEVLRKEAESKLQEYDVQLTKLRRPRIKIIGYKGELDKDELNICLREQNKFIEDTDEMEITYIKRNKKNGLCTIYGECKPSLFHKFMAVKKIYIGWERYPIYEDLSINRCFKCQEHYHKSDKCPNKTVCEYCCEEHDIHECPKSQVKCYNCMKANDKYRTNYSINHTASDIKCPSYQYLLNILRSKIDYGYGF